MSVGLLDMFRGLSNIPTAVGAEGAAGAAKAFMQPQKYENMRGDEKYRKAYAPFIDTISELSHEGDLNSALVSIKGLQERMRANGAPDEDIQRFTKGIFADAQGIAQAKTPINTPEGQNMALQAATVMNPEQAGTAAQVAAKMPALQMSGQAAQADINRTNAATATSQATVPLLSAQAGESQARTRAYDRGDMAKRGVGANLNNMFRGNAGTINQMDKQILGFFKPTAAGGAVDLDVAHQQAEEQLKQRNFTAAALGMPEAELTPIYQTQESGTNDPRDMAASGPLTTYALRPKQEAAAPEKKPVSFEALPPLPPVEARPLAQTDAMAGIQAPQGRPNFQAAVQNPLGALPADFRNAILDPSQPINATYVGRYYQQQGYSPEESNALVEGLLRQIQPSAQAPGSPAYQPPPRDPFAPNF